MTAISHLSCRQSIACVALESQSWQAITTDDRRQLQAQLGDVPPVATEAVTGQAHCDRPLTADDLRVGMAVAVPAAEDCIAYDAIEGTLPPGFATREVAVACRSIRNK